jgi:hypothetical protein
VFLVTNICTCVLLCILFYCEILSFIVCFDVRCKCPVCIVVS